MSMSFSDKTKESIRILFKIYYAFQTDFEKKIVEKNMTKSSLIIEYLNNSISPHELFDIEPYLTRILSIIRKRYLIRPLVFYSEAIERISNVEKNIYLPPEFENISIYFRELNIAGWMFPSGQFILEITISADIATDQLEVLPSIIRSTCFEFEKTLKVSFEDKNWKNKEIDDIATEYQDSIISRIGGNLENQFNYIYPVVYLLTDRSTIEDHRKNLVSSITSFNQDFDVGKPYEVSSTDNILVMISGIGSLFVTNQDGFEQYRNLFLIALEELFLADQSKNELQKYCSDIKLTSDLVNLVAARENLEKYQMKIFFELLDYDAVEMTVSRRFPRILRIFSGEFGIYKKRNDTLSLLEFSQNYVSTFIKSRIEDNRQQVEQDIQRKILYIQNIFILGVSATIISTFLVFSQHISFFYPLFPMNGVIYLIFYVLLIAIISFFLYLVFKGNTWRLLSRKRKR